MVGKANRTKNNVKASNSGRSAQLLANLPNSSFIGFSTLKDAALHTTPDLFDESIVPEFQIILKKMYKKDSVTKHKALHEFAELCNSADLEILKPVVPLWPRLYSILSIDIENRVREATQFAHKCMVIRVKKNIAPYLKHLIGPWIVSHYDTYPPAASIAKTSFEDVFPPLKRTEVFTFCKEDLFNYIVDNLIVQTPQTLSNPKITDAINMEMKYERVIASTLQAYALFISKLSPDILQSTSADHTDHVLSTSKFWKLQKHESGLIRSSWYLLVATFVEKCPQVFESDLKKVAVAIFSHLNEADVKVNAQVWEAALYCVVRYEAQLWSCVSVEKLVIPHVCSTLERGFHGNATQIAPKLLPLLSKLPEQTNRSVMYEKILSSCLSYIESSASKQNSSEVDAMMKCYTECCRYVLKTQPNCELASKIVFEYLLPLYKLPVGHVQFALTVRYLYQIEIEPSLIDSLWETLKQKLSGENMEEELCLHASLVQCLWNPYNMRKTDSRVRFQEENAIKNPQTNTQNGLDSPCFQFTSHVHSLVSHLTQQLLTALNGSTRRKAFILHVCKLSVFLDETFIYNLLPLPGSFNAWALEAGDSVYELAVKYISRLNLSSEQSLQMFRTLSAGQTMALFTWCLSHYNNNTVLSWLQDLSLQDTIQSLVDQVIRGSRSHTELLTKCYGHGKIRIHPDIAEQVYGQLVGLFKKFGSNSNESLIDYENCARVVKILIQANIGNTRDPVDVKEKKNTSEENASMLRGLMEAIIKNEQVEHMQACWESAVSYIQPNDRCKESLYQHLHNLCVEICTSQHSCTVPGDHMEPERSVPHLDLCFENDTEFDDLGAKGARLVLSLLGTDFGRIPFRPISFISRAFEMWHVQSCARGNDVYASEDNVIIPEWNLHESEHLHSVYWNIVVYLRLMLESLRSATSSIRIHDCSQIESDERKMEDDKIGTEDGENNRQIQENNDPKESNERKIAHDSSEIEDANRKIDDPIGREHLISKLELMVSDLSADYCVYCVLMQDYGRYLPPRSNVIDDLLAELHSSFDRNQDIKSHQEKFENNILDKIALPYSTCKIDKERDDRAVFLYHYDVERRIGCVERRHEVIADEFVTSGVDDLIKLSSNVSSLRHQITRESFVSFVRDHSKDELDSKADVQKITSLVQVFAKLLNRLNEGEREDLEHVVNSIRGEIMLCVTSQLVVYFTLVTSTMDEIPLISTDRILLASQLLRCYQEIDKFCLSDTDSEFCIEWKSVFAEDCEAIISHIWLMSANSDRPRTLASLLLLDDLCATLYNSSRAFSTLNAVCPLLLAASRVVQITVHDVMCKYDVIESYDVIAATLTSGQTVVDSMLANFSLGDTCIVLPGTDSYTYSFGYLLMWSLIVRRCDMVEDNNSDVAEVALWLKENGYASALMRILLALMPESIVHCTESVQNAQALFSSSRPLQPTDVWTSSNLSSLACRVYYQVLARFPALVRAWWNDSTPQEATLVEKLTTKYVSPLLCAEELRRAVNFKQENMQILVFPGTKEVVATYSLEEASMELTITLPSNHPLGVIKVDSMKNLFPNTQWIKQITKFLIHANGSICDGLASWKSSMDKKFDGVEECYICFCILHSRNHELPRKSCRTCQKKFHSYCLFKWFTTSNKSTCPICRNLF